MTTNSARIGNMTASGHSLRELITRLTGVDPLGSETDPAAFMWSNDLACSDCQVVDSTAVVSIDGDHDERLCFHCLDALL